MKINELKITGSLVILHIMLMLTAGIILIFTFEFPDILRAPMETTLGLFIKNKAYTVPAYYLFSLTGISFITIVLLLYKTVDFRESTPAFLALFFVVLFGLTSSLGFMRWPFLMQHLGELVSIANDQELEVLKIVYNAFHIYAGVSIGENFAFWFEFLWMFLFSTALLSKKEVFPVYLARTGQILGIGMLVYSLEQFGGIFSALGPLNMIVHTAQLGWLLALAFCLYNVGNSRQSRLSGIQLLAATGLFTVLVIVSFI